MSGRFGPMDPFYVAMTKAESEAGIERIVLADAVRFVRRMMARQLSSPIIDHDPGDEDVTR